MGIHTCETETLARSNSSFYKTAVVTKHLHFEVRPFGLCLTKQSGPVQKLNLTRLVYTLTQVQFSDLRKDSVSEIFT